MFRQASCLKLLSDSEIGECEFGNDRGMIGGALQPARNLIDLTAFTDCRQRRADQNVVNTQAKIAPECSGAVIPPTEGPFGLRE